MTPAAERFANWCGQTLNPAERDAAIGDLIEAGTPNPQAIWQVLGLVSRRQLRLWRNWRPWLALLGIVGLSGFLLNRMALQNSVSLVLDWRTRLHYGAPYQNGLTPAQNEFMTVSGWIAVASWSWSSGLLAGVFARKASWIPALLLCLYAIWLAALSLRFLNVPKANGHYLFWLFPPLMQFCIFLFPMLAGIHLGQHRAPRLPTAISLAVWTLLIAAVMTCTGGWWQQAMVRWSEGAWHPPVHPWPVRSLPYLFLSWPAACLAALAHQQKRKTLP